MKTRGRHLIGELYGCEPLAADDVPTVLAAARRAAIAIGATVVGECVHKYTPQGVTVTLAISESHISIHTWPEAGYVAADIFTCGEGDPHPGMVVIGEALGARSARVQEILRGLLEDSSDRAAPAPGVLVMAQAVAASRLTDPETPD